MDKMLYVRNFKNDLIAGYFVEAFDAMMRISNHLQSNFIPKDREHRDYLFNMIATFLSVGGLIDSNEDIIKRIQKFKHPLIQLVHIRNFIFSNFLKIINNDDDEIDIHFYKMENCSIEMCANKGAGKFETTVYPDEDSLINRAHLAFGCILIGMEINPSKILRCKRDGCLKFYYAGKPGLNWNFKRKYCSIKCGDAQRLKDWRVTKKILEISL